MKIGQWLKKKKYIVIVVLVILLIISLFPLLRRTEPEPEPEPATEVIEVREPKEEEELIKRETEELDAIRGR